MAKTKFQPRYRPTNGGEALTTGQILFTGEGEMYGNADGTGTRPLHSVHVVADTNALNLLPVSFRSDKRIYRVGNDLYRWNGTNTGTIADWALTGGGSGLSQDDMALLQTLGEKLTAEGFLPLHNV